MRGRPLLLDRCEQKEHYCLAGLQSYLFGFAGTIGMAQNEPMTVKDNSKMYLQHLSLIHI